MRRATAIACEPCLAAQRVLSRSAPHAGRHAFTLIELLAVVAIIALLLGILLPVLGRVRGQMKTLQCSSNLRSVTFQFQLFAEGERPGGRGDSDRSGKSRFSIDDFQESLYRIDEFWDVPDQNTVVLSPRNELMLCPAKAARLRKNRGLPCGSEAIGPPEDVSLALNKRLHQAVVSFLGNPVLAPVASTHVRADVLNHPHVPLALDVDGRRAVSHGVPPFYVAPPLPNVDDPYADGRYWSPAARHAGQVCVAFVGGHVLKSRRPEMESWDWSYQAEVGN
jgi:prepilin-type N-terminal cleavage/methylation domain-containing protein